MIEVTRGLTERDIEALARLLPGQVIIKPPYPFVNTVIRCGCPDMRDDKCRNRE